MSAAKQRAISEAAAQIGQSVSAWRRAQRMTQADMAQRAHTSAGTISPLFVGVAIAGAAISST